MNKRQDRFNIIVSKMKKASSVKKSRRYCVSEMKKQQNPLFEEHYAVNQFFMYMAGFYDRRNKACTIVRETNRMFVVEKSPLEILDYSIKKVGYTLKGAMETSREHNGKTMCPIMVNLLLELVLFPTQSAKHVETIWLNPNQIHRTDYAKYIDRKTNIEFKNGNIITVDSRLSSLNNKLKRAEQYRDSTVAAAKPPLSLIKNSNMGKFFLLTLVTIKWLPSIFEIMY
ncbi:competence protein ComK [Neobacillus sp. PS3-12]|uniref:competence protein ComK n=1 Tax=Neobacillus sp. PS3-12 TaxID=3070677 RepID=UPI0027E135B9|nr:competence protein ComK [Neobacillus sp. PS3-12]WML55157.1 competence protein ComK [Neobacillus sp. PS3-12]